MSCSPEGWCWSRGRVFRGAGLKREWRERRWVVVWLVAGLLFLLVWPTKWPQYTLIVVPAICLTAGMTLLRAYRWVRQQNAYWDWFAQMRPELSWYVWMITVVSVGFVAAIYMWGLLGVVLGSIMRVRSLAPRCGTGSTGWRCRWPAAGLADWM